MNRHRFGALLALAVLFGAFSHAPKALAAAEVHRMNLVISANPSQINGGGMNDLLDRYNEYPLSRSTAPHEPLEKITMGWMFDTEVRYFARPNFAVCAGVGYLKSETKREYLPGIGMDINVRGQVLTVPIHVGGLYYLAPYTQGDFQARAYIGGGLLSLAGSRAIFEVSEAGLIANGDTLDSNNLSLGGSSKLTARGDGPGFYLEAGAHLFFAARYSLMIGAVYRSAKLRTVSNTGGIVVPDDLPRNPHLKMPLLERDGVNPVRIHYLDLSGVGVKMAVGIGL